MLWRSLVVCLLFAGSALSDEYTVLPESADPPPAKMLKSYLLQQAQQHFDARRDAVARLESADDIQRRQRELKDRFRNALGHWPEPTPLNAVVVGRVPRDGFAIEKVIYESRPQHHVTASFYLPEGKGPFPGVLMPIGHSINGKGAEYIQRGAALLARHGIAVLTYDPIGQGERRQLLDADGKAAINGSTSEHTLTGVGALLVGRNTASYRVWDGMRSLDYLASRPEVDPKRLGCTGCSGGGTETSYIMALDDRIGAAAPSCYLTSLERLFATIGPQDAEQNITGQVAFGLDHADYVLLHAPRPTLICAATQDFFDIQGTHATFREAKRNYELLAAGQRMELFESNTKHGFPQPQREAVLRWMRRWLLDKNDDLKEGEYSLLPDAELFCTQSGQVLSELKGKSVFDLNAERAKELGESRRRNNRSRQDLVGDVRRLLALPQKVEPARRQPSGSTEGEGYTVAKRIYTTQPGIEVPALHWQPREPQGRPIVYVHDRGKAAAREDIQRLVKEGRTVLALDLRGWGETAAKPGDAKSFFGGLYHETFLSLHLNRPLLGQRVLDLLAVLHAEDASEWEAMGSGAGGLVVLHAALLDERIQAVSLKSTLASWESVTRSPISYEQLEHAVPGVLAAYDLPDVAAALAPRKLTVREPLDPQQTELGPSQIETAYAPVRAAYDQQQAAIALTIE